MGDEHKGPSFTRRDFLIKSGLGLAAAGGLPGAAGAQKQRATLLLQKPIRVMPIRFKRPIGLSRLAKTAFPEIHPRLADVKISATAKERAAKALQGARQAAQARRPELLRQKVVALDTRLGKTAAVTRAKLKARPQRTPDAIIAQWMGAARGRVAPGTETIFLIQTKPTSLTKVEAKVRQILGLPTVGPLIGGAASVETLFPKRMTDRMFVLRLRIPRETVGKDIHSLASAIRRKGEFVSVVPDRAMTVMQGPGPTVDTDLSVPGDIQWHIDLMRVRQAWQVPPPAQGQSKGKGVVVGHPDSGWHTHNQYDENRIDKARSANTLGETPVVGGMAAVHALPSNSKNFTVTHGTGTGNLIVSADDSNHDRTTGHATEEPETQLRKVLNVCGVAPDAMIIPIKCMGDNDPLGVVRISDVALGRAIDYAVDQKVDVISISLGGVAHPAVEAAVVRAIEHDIIVVAAAGQSYGAINILSPDDTVVEPAALPGVIAVAGSTPRSKPWKDSHYGPNVDITAPAYGVWHGSFDEGGSDDEVIRAGAGTSFSTALTAGTAALWVAHWGRNNLRDRYPNTPLAHVFRQVLQQSAIRPNGWDTQRFGPGMVNVQALLQTALPAESQVVPPPATNRNTVVVVGDIVRDLNEAWYVLEDLAQDSVELGSRLARAGSLLARRAAEETMSWLGEQYAAAVALAEQTAGDVKAKAEQTVAALERMMADAAEAAEEAAAQAAETAEETAEAAGDVVEAVVNTAGEVAEDVWNWLFG
jgi:hypothetical protein